MGADGRCAVRTGRYGEIGRRGLDGFASFALALVCCPVPVPLLLLAWLKASRYLPPSSPVQPVPVYVCV